jgi:hypothetical protein
MLNLSLVSDLHIDTKNQPPLELPGGDILLLAGDLCEIRSIFSKYLFIEPKTQKEAEARRDSLIVQLAKYKKVYSVLGNHEHYNSDINKTAVYYRLALPEVELLENTWVHLSDKVVLFGATLWTDLDRGNPLVDFQAKTWSDYCLIQSGERLLKTSDTLFAFNSTISALYKCLDENPDKDIIVMTHFCPSSRSSAPRFRMSANNPFFVSDLDEIMVEYPQIKVWAHGHTHDPYDYTIEGCRVICNPRGYAFESPVKIYKPLEFNLGE